MIVFIVSRVEFGRHAMWPPFANPFQACSMIDAHIAFRVNDGARVNRRIVSVPAPMPEGWKVRVGGSDGHPIMTDAPECINCIVLEVEVEAATGEKTIYNITQAAIQ